MSVTVRPAQSRDVDDVLAVWATSDVEPTVSDNRDSLHRLLAHDPAALLVAERGAQIVGTLIATWDGWRASMWRLAVRPDQRRHGVARALVKSAEHRLKALGVTRIATFVVTTDRAPGDFWTACGYEPQTQRRRFVKNLDPETSSRR